MPGRVTAADVARRAGVSRSAVSRAFTPGASVSDRTAEKVRQAAEALGYRPNALARGLLTGRSRMIGLVLAYLDNHFYPEAIDRLSRALEAEGYNLLVFFAAQDDDGIDAVVAEILDYQVDGLILASVGLGSELAGRCRASGVPVVMFNRRSALPDDIAAVSDNVAGGRLAAEHLIACGYRRIGHIAGWENAATQKDREAGFLDGLSEAGLSLAARTCGEFRPDIAKDAARAMFAGPDRPEAVFVANDYMAFMVLDVLRGELGLSVPGEVGVIGFDDVPTASWPAYALTTIRQDTGALVARTVALLLAQIAGTRESPPAPLPVRLVERGTTRRIAPKNQARDQP